MRRYTALFVALASLLGLVSAACEPARLGRRPRRAAVLDHDDQELAAEGAAIADGWRRDGGYAVGGPILAPDGATRATALVRLLADDAPVPVFEARGFYGGAPATDWVPAAGYFGEGNVYVVVAELPPSESGARVDAVELRVPESALESVSDLRWSAIDPTLIQDTGDGESGVVRAELRSDLSGLGIVTREEWGARGGSCSSTDGSRSRISIHHTEGPASDPERQLRGVQSYHISRGWCDIGYHFLIDSTGRIYEGRRLELLGAHVRDNNRGNIGIAFIGCFDTGECSSVTPLTDAMIESAGRLVGTLSNLFGITPSSSTVRGHRDQVSTTCPGNRLYPRIADIIRVGSTETLGGGGTPPPEGPPPSDPPPAGGAVCTHSFGGTYASGACSSSYQCCEGTWRTRGTGCGTCTCVEGTGRTGCSGTSPPADPPPVDPPPPPPPAPSGASCTHSFGGTYAHTACSSLYQCCDGGWSPRSAGCGTCLCVEASGTSGCGGGGPSMPPPMPSSLPYAGLSLGGSEIPRAGLTNPTLRSTLGISTEPYGDVTTYDGASFVRGTVSWFGGPDDTGVTATETGAITGERLRDLNNPLSPSASTLASRPEDYYYVAMRWSYSPNSTRWWRDARLLIVNPSTGAAIVVRPVDWGPNTRTRRILDLSPQALEDLGLSTDGEALVAFAPAGTALGRVR